MSLVKKTFTEKSFTLFVINYIAGFGFVGTVLPLINGGFGFLSILVILLGGFITFAIALVYSRLANEYRKTEDGVGGIYLFSKKLNNRPLSFFVGWIQYIQSPITGSAAPLFLVVALTSSQLVSSEVGDSTAYAWGIRFFSIAVFVVLVLISTFGLKSTKYVILISGVIKWLTIFIAFALALYIGISNNLFNGGYLADTETTFENAHFGTRISSFLALILTFMFAFGGVEDMSTMLDQVKFKNFRKVLLLALLGVTLFYIVGYLILAVLSGLGIEKRINNFAGIYRFVWQTTGAVIFLIGTLFNFITSRLSIIPALARKIVPLAEDGYLPSKLSQLNKKGEYVSAIVFVAVVNILATFFFVLIPFAISPDAQANFQTVLDFGNSAFMIGYFNIFLIAFLLAKKKSIESIPIWEQIIYVLTMVLIALLLINFLFPVMFTLNSWETINTLNLILSIVVFLIMPLAFYYLTPIFNKWSAKRANKKLATNTANKENVADCEQKKQETTISS